MVARWEPETPVSNREKVQPGEPVGWLVVEQGSELKCCPECGGLALEGQEECTPCGCHPTDDTSWRIAGRTPKKRAPWADDQEGAGT